MTEQMSQEHGWRSSRGGWKQEEGEYHSDIENVAEENQRNGRTVHELVQAADPELSSRRKPALIRSKTFDHSLLTQVQTEPDSKLDRKKSHYSQVSKGNCQYHKIFKEISKEEQLRQSYTCALQKDILYQGRMFVSDHWICFHSKVFGKDTKIAIPVVSVIQIKKTKTAILVPNALVIATENDRYVFVSLLARDNTYKVLMSVCLHLEEKSPCSSPIPSSAESSFRGQRSPLGPCFPMSFPGDLSDLDGAVRQRRQELEESSSSDSQTPDYEKLAEFPVAPFLEVLNHMDRVASPTHLVNNNNNQQQKHQTNQQTLDQNQNETKSADSEEVIDNRILRTVSLNTLLFVYMVLVCVLVLSSCYLAFKIVSLEETLSTLGSVVEFTHHRESDFLRSNSDLNTKFFSELLTINLMKLEKVQKNLQRLLDEAA
ncbi:GRAM domain-containing protein 2B [Cynoglossus semilaevis]|uniref:GRAM domain containing 2B n=1 Tax=Cynoglossus semilaevis TaxID=244447 RepID=A0A3P8VME9_CYNSE|nr:GRAM domain-containing protein 2B [Cynoglossus semilaevis]